MTSIKARTNKCYKAFHKIIRPINQRDDYDNMK